MKALLLTVAAVCFASFAIPCSGQTFTIDPVTNCPGVGSGHNIGLVGPFTYHIKWVSGAYSTVPDDSLYGGHTWGARVHYYMYASGQYGSFGDAANTLYPSEAEAEAAAQGVYALDVPLSGTVEFYIEELGTPGVCADNRGSITLQFVTPTPVGDRPSAMTELFSNVPNPFNPATAVRFSLAQREHVRIDIYDVAGKFVRNLVDGARPAGLQQVGWNGTDANDRPMASGVYFIRMSTADQHFARKIVLLK